MEVLERWTYRELLLRMRKQEVLPLSSEKRLKAKDSSPSVSLSSARDGRWNSPTLSIIQEHREPVEKSSLLTYFW